MGDWIFHNIISDKKLLWELRVWRKIENYFSLNNVLIDFEKNMSWVSMQQYYIRCTNKFPPFFIKNWASIVKERNLMFYWQYCLSYCSCCVWHESWSSNASNSASSYTFGLPLCSLSSMSNSPFLKFWNHSRQLPSLKAASPYVSIQAIDALQL